MKKLEKLLGYSNSEKLSNELIKEKYKGIRPFYILLVQIIQKKHYFNLLDATKNVGEVDRIFS